MGIVSAGMHGTFLCGGKGQTCFFRYRQRIHIRTNRHAGSFSVADQPHYRMTILKSMDFQSQGCQLFFNIGLRPRLFPASFRVMMQFSAHGNHLRHNVLQCFLPI